MRDLHLIVPTDCVAAIDPEDGRYSLGQMEKVLKADVLPSEEIDFDALMCR